jgi:hypothetical protein
MTKFVLLVFGFLAVAFYEMSGGAGFSATAARMAAVEARKAEIVGAVTRLDTAAPSDRVARSSLNLVSFSDVTGEGLDVVKDDPELRARAAAAATGVASVRSGERETVQQATALPASIAAAGVADQAAGSVAPGTETTVALSPSPLDVRPAGEDATTAIRFEGNTSRASSRDVAAQLPLITDPNTSAPQQIRRVNGDLVNLRAGPGTSNAVVGRLPRGAAVEVLGDNGAGWVRLRPLDGGPEGWIADFLLTRG